MIAEPNPHGKCRLTQYNISPKLFDTIRDTEIYAGFLEKVGGEDFHKLERGYQPKYYHTVYTDSYGSHEGKEYLIVSGRALAYYTGKEDLFTDWKQYILYKDLNRTEADFEKGGQKSITGPRALHTLMKVVKKHYTYEQIKDIFHSHEAEYNPDLIQIHRNDYLENTILKCEDCYEYDLNAAYGDAFIALFPEAKKEIQWMFDHRHDTIKGVGNFYKAVLNYSSGCLNSEQKWNTSVSEPYYFPKTYNWIVQRVRETVDKAIDYVGGELIYANTDGFIVSAPKRHITPSKEIGQFKLEFHGDVYVYQHLVPGYSGFWLIQEVDKDGNIVVTKGCNPNQFNDYNNLPKGIVYQYKTYIKDGVVRYENGSQINVEVTQFKREVI